MRIPNFEKMKANWAAKMNLEGLSILASIAFLFLKCYASVITILIYTSKYLGLFVECRRVSIQVIFIYVILLEEKI
jgi:hypothetical protein